MGCKCANSTEDTEEINKNALADGNGENTPNDFNKNFNKNENLLGFGDQENANQDENQNQNNNPSIPYNSDEMNQNDNKNNNDPNLKYADYPEKIIELINNIREDPVGYADIIEDSMKYIVEEEDKNDPSNIRLIFKKKVFQEAADYLRSLTPLPPLEFVQEKCIPLPENEDELKDPTFLREQVRKIRETTDVDVFFKDLIKIPEVSGLLMIVDDTNKNAGKKRMALLNKNLKYVGVTSKFIGKTFIAYFAFSK